MTVPGNRIRAGLLAIILSALAGWWCVVAVMAVALSLQRRDRKRGWALRVCHLPPPARDAVF